MSSKSRVILYAELRKQISNIDDYSFDTKALSKEIEEKITNQDEKSDANFSSHKASDGIRRNTFSMSIDELIREHNEYDSKAQEKETQNRLHQIKKEKRKKKNFAFTIVLWTSIAIVAVVFILLLTLILMGVI